MKTSEIELDPWQKEILEHDGNCLLCTGRQVGKTTIFAIKSAEYMIKHPQSKIIVVSLTEDQAKLIIVMILDYLEKNYRTYIAKGKNKPTQNKVILRNGSQVIARPVGTTGDAVRGFTGDVLLIDEASRMPELVWTASRPTLLTTGGNIWICSTPFGKQGYFWEAFQNANDKYRVWHVSSEEVMRNREINNFWTNEKKESAIKFLENEKKDMSVLQYGQEYLGLFLEDLQQYFSDELIDKACVLDKPNPLPRDNIYMGVDIARMGGDEITYEFIRKRDKDSFHHIENIVRKGQLTTKTEDDIIHLTRFFNPVKVGIDAGSGSLGVGIFDHLIQNTITKRKVIPMNNRQISLDSEGKKKQRIFKEDMYDNLKNMMERGEIKLLDSEDVRQSLKSIQWELTEGTITKVKIFGNYAHIVEGLIRAAWLAKKEKNKKFFIDYI